MELNQDTFRTALDAYYKDRVSIANGVRKAIETYLDLTFQPGELVVGEAVQPQRDYRKELWIGIRLQDADIAEANAALADFDKVFPKENNHG